MACPGGGLSVRQKQIYKYKCNIYRLLTPPAGTEAGPYNPVPHLVNVPFFFDSTPETDGPTVIGRTKAINIFVLDNCYFPVAYRPTRNAPGLNVDVRDTDILKMIYQPGGATNLLGVYWACQGNPQPQAFLLADLMIYAKRIGTTPPAGLS